MTAFFLRVLTPIIVAIVTVAGSVWVAYIQTRVGKVEQESFGSIEDGQKLCVVASGTFRDSVIVPKSWTTDMCFLYMEKMGANNFRLGCVFAAQISLSSSKPTSAPDSADKPNPDCGW
jgi:hypothetical protein